MQLPKKYQNGYTRAEYDGVLYEVGKQYLYRGEKVKIRGVVETKCLVEIDGEFKEVSYSTLKPTKRVITLDTEKKKERLPSTRTVHPQPTKDAPTLVPVVDTETQQRLLTRIAELEAELQRCIDSQDVANEHGTNTELVERVQELQVEIEELKAEPQTPVVEPIVEPTTGTCVVRKAQHGSRATIQIRFANKPDASTREQLKKKGFFWYNKEGGYWGAFYTDARYAYACEVCGCGDTETIPVAPVDAQPVVEPIVEAPVTPTPVAPTSTQKWLTADEAKEDTYYKDAYGNEWVFAPKGKAKDVFLYVVSKYIPKERNSDVWYTYSYNLDSHHDKKIAQLKEQGIEVVPVMGYRIGARVIETKQIPLTKDVEIAKRLDAEAERIAAMKKTRRIDMTKKDGTTVPSNILEREWKDGRIVGINLKRRVKDFTGKTIEVLTVGYGEKVEDEASYKILQPYWVGINETIEELIKIKRYEMPFTHEEYYYSYVAHNAKRGGKIATANGLKVIATYSAHFAYKDDVIAAGLMSAEDAAKIEVKEVTVAEKGRRVNIYQPTGTQVSRNSVLKELQDGKMMYALSRYASMRHDDAYDYFHTDFYTWNNKLDSKDRLGIVEALQGKKGYSQSAQVTRIVVGKYIVDAVRVTDFNTEWVVMYVDDLIAVQGDTTPTPVTNKGTQEIDENGNLVSKKATYISTKFLREQQAKPKPVAPVDTETVVEPVVEAPVTQESPSKSTDTIVLRLDEVRVDTARFQPREKLDETRVQEIVNNYNPLLLNPIKVWRDDSGVYWLLGGHHRYEALKRLQKETVEAKVFVGSESEAIAIAYSDNVRDARPQTSVENAKYIRHLKNSVKTKEEALKQCESLYSRSCRTIWLLSLLDDESAVVQDMKLLDSSSEVYKERETQAKWIATVVETYPELTRQHQNELYNYLKENYRTVGKKITSANDFVSTVEPVILARFPFGNVVENEPLNLNNYLGRNAAEQMFDERIEEAEKELREAKKALEKQLAKLAQIPNLTEENKQRALQKYNDAVLIAQRELIKLREQGGKADFGNQNSLFGLGSLRESSVVAANSGVATVDAEVQQQCNERYEIDSCGKVLSLQDMLSPMTEKFYSIADARSVRMTPVGLVKTRALFERISKRFLMLIWGSAGQGKSSFELLLADDLARNGKTLLLLREERISTGRVGARARMMGVSSSANLILNDTMSLYELQRFLENDSSVQFVIVDSITVWDGITEEELNNLIDMFPSVSFVFVAQSNKAGREYRGFTGLANRVDTVVYVEDGQAETTKHRDARLSKMKIFKGTGAR